MCIVYLLTKNILIAAEIDILLGRKKLCSNILIKNYHLYRYYKNWGEGGSPFCFGCGILIVLLHKASCKVLKT